MVETLNISIIGGGIGGLATAIALLKHDESNSLAANFL
jgi:2-polyprenyl-6-methoxyphenol hydroxylase-like FAD-dependent oxidoreductase